MSKARDTREQGVKLLLQTQLYFDHYPVTLLPISSASKESKLHLWSTFQGEEEQEIQRAINLMEGEAREKKNEEKHV